MELTILLIAVLVFMGLWPLAKVMPALQNLKAELLAFQTNFKTATTDLEKEKLAQTFTICFAKSLAKATARFTAVLLGVALFILAACWATNTPYQSFETTALSWQGLIATTLLGIILYALQRSRK